MTSSYDPEVQQFNQYLLGIMFLKKYVSKKSTMIIFLVKIFFNTPCAMFLYCDAVILNSFLSPNKPPKNHKKQRGL